MKPVRLPFPAFLLAVVALLGLAPAQDPQRFPRLTAEQAEMLSHFSLVDLDDGFGNPVRTLRVTGLNLQLVNGLGTSTSDNGTGNLILGYAEANAGTLPIDRRGSHNVVVGPNHGWASHAGLVVGERNRLEDSFTVIAGGSDNRAAAPYASVLGGTDNEALNAYSVVAGGVWNDAVGYLSTILGGENNTTSAYAAAVAGGSFNTASGSFASVAGGTQNRASGESATVSGGLDRLSPGAYDWAAGTLYEDE